MIEIDFMEIGHKRDWKVAFLRSIKLNCAFIEHKLEKFFFMI